jgi:3-dehydroquinate synthase
VGESLDNLHQYIPDGQALIITDTTVAELYGNRFPQLPTIVIGTGEKAKRLETVVRIYREFIDHEVDRDTFVIGIGGGIVCDITGFAASTFMRGLSFGFVATTLLAQVDASVGGKNGVNFDGFKNMVGLFNQPEFVICDPAVLKTLSRADVANGLAEVVKHALIADKSAFEFIEANAAEILELSPGVIENLIHDAVRIKADIVERDELEKGERRKLNFGHTLGHAVESVTGMPHGEAVSVGMAAAAALSEKRGLITGDDAKRIVGLLESLGLPTVTTSDPKDLIAKLHKDKKRSGQVIHFILLKAIGMAVVEKIPLVEIERICQTHQKQN